MHRLFAAHRSAALSMRHGTKCRGQATKAARFRIETCRQRDILLGGVSGDLYRPLCNIGAHSFALENISGPLSDSVEYYFIILLMLNFCVTPFVSLQHVKSEGEEGVEGEEEEEEQFLEITAILSN